MSEETFDPNEPDLKTADSLPPPRYVSLPPGPLSSNGIVVKVCTLLSLAALVGITAWGAYQVWISLPSKSGQDEGAPEADAALLLERCAAARSKVTQEPKNFLLRDSPAVLERAKSDDECEFRKRPD